jgi:predicted dehydrogenase
MIDHVVHVTDLLRDLLGEEVATVQAQIGSNVYGKDWEDTAMVTMSFPSGVFATLDSSWSRPNSFKTWGDVTMTVTGDKGVVEMDMFGPALDVYSAHTPFHSAGYGSNLDLAMVEAFLDAVRSKQEPPVTLKDGIQAARVAMAGYRSVEVGAPVALDA